MDGERMSDILRSKRADLSWQERSSPLDSRDQLIEGLRQQLGRGGAAAETEGTVFSCGAAAIDQFLPGSGLRHGMLIEWLSEKGAAATLGLLSAREACHEGGVLVVVDRAQTFYPPVAAAWGVDLERLIVVHPRNARDELWALVQTLRSPVVAALWANIERLDSKAFRRLQLAAEAGRTLGVLLRPASARGQPTWADARLEVESCGFRIADCGLTQPIRNPQTTIHNRLVHYVRVHLTHCRLGRAGGASIIEIDDAARTVQHVSSRHDAHPLRVVTELADSTSHPRSARA
jgi:protein ImuA